MASLDIVSLYPSTDTHEVSNKICDDIEQIEDLEDYIKLIKRGLNLIILNIYFTFNGKYYKQNHGGPMGSPILGLSAEYTLHPSETEYFSTFQLKPHVCQTVRFFYQSDKDH